MAVMEREGWTDERIDKAFDRVDADLREIRIDIKKGFERTDDRLDTVQREMNARFESLQREMNTRFESLQGEMNARSESLQGEMNARFEASLREMTARFDAVQRNITTWFIALFSIIFSLAAAVAFA